MFIECAADTAHHLAEQIVEEVWHHPGGESGIENLLAADMDGGSVDIPEEPQRCACGEGKRSNSDQLCVYCSESSNRKLQYKCPFQNLRSIASLLHLEQVKKYIICCVRKKCFRYQKPLAYIIGARLFDLMIELNNIDSLIMKKLTLFCFQWLKMARVKCSAAILTALLSVILHVLWIMRKRCLMTGIVRMTAETLSDSTVAGR